MKSPSWYSSHAACLLGQLYTILVAQTVGQELQRVSKTLSGDCEDDTVSTIHLRHNLPILCLFSQSM